MFNKDQKLNRMTLKGALLVITYSIALIWVVIHMSDVLQIIAALLNMMKPFIYGFSLAFLFNLPMKFYMRKLPNTLGKWKSFLAVMLSLASIAIVVTFIISIVLPQVVDSVMTLVNALPGYIVDTVDTIEKLIENQNIPTNALEELSLYSTEIQDFLVNVLKNGLPQFLTIASGFASGIANLFLSIVIAVYVTVSKHKLIAQAKQFLYAFTSETINRYVLRVARLSNETFSNFVTGQMLEAIIIGVLCYIGCLILRFPYAPIVSVIIGCTNIIPIFGAIFGVGLSALLVAFVNPLQGLFFVIFGICLQQFESNLIYPRVVGSSVGLSGLWVLLAVTIGGGLFSFVGMLLGLPTFSVIYALLREEMHRRTQLKDKAKIAVKQEVVHEEA